MIMKARIKNIAERAAGHRFWIERATPRDRVLRLIRSLRPISTVAPLIRLGPKGDGGYLVPDDLDGISACVSPGVSTEVGFDNAMADRGIDVYMADASVDGPPVNNSKFHFIKKYLGVVDDEVNIRLDQIGSLISDDDLILQMDIEGAEWRVLLDTSSQMLNRFRIMIIEFHDLKQMFSHFSFDLMEATFHKILQTHSVVHLHPNNILKPYLFNGVLIPSIMEVTFYRNDREFLREVQPIYPNSLDCDNVQTKPSIELSEIWR
ncbi:FkbM family methyltransferase [Mesorhizobium sp. ISC15]|uniref:FkbM family methyltransferase n=1 Tax=Mesorhizobium sp. ISC15 TaxID=3076429 RepID=UPI00301D9797